MIRLIASKTWRDRKTRHGLDARQREAGWRQRPLRPGGGRAWPTGPERPAGEDAGPEAERPAFRSLAPGPPFLISCVAAGSPSSELPSASWGAAGGPAWRGRYDVSLREALCKALGAMPAAEQTLRGYCLRPSSPLALSPAVR